MSPFSVFDDADYQDLSSIEPDIEKLCQPGAIEPVVQPIVRIADMRIVGYEALARMPTEPIRPPEWWLDRSELVGMRPELEVACWKAISNLGMPPEDVLLFVNISPSTLSSPELLSIRQKFPDRFVIEVAEQRAVENYADMRQWLEPWLAGQALIAIDDAGAGYSSFRHVVELSPDYLKIDEELISGIDGDRTRQALVRALIAFAREMGATVIAEGVETAAEMNVLREMKVDCAQGNLLARPSAPWPRVDSVAAAKHEAGRRIRGSDEFWLVDVLGQATDVRSACETVVEYLFRWGNLMPSLYLEAEGQLRCLAQRGLWQVLDGMPGSAGVTGRTWANGEPVFVDNVNRSTDYLEAIPGVTCEICVPVLVEGRPVGALNVESLTSFPPGTFELVTICADLLAGRLAQIGWYTEQHPWQRAAHASKLIAALPIDESVTLAGLRGIVEAACMDSGCVILRQDDFDVAAVTGPLGDSFSALSGEEIRSLSRLVDQVSSCYTAGDSTGRGFMGTESLRTAGARAVVVLPLVAGKERLGVLVLANSRPMRITGMEVEPLEMVAGHFAATITASGALAPA